MKMSRFTEEHERGVPTAGVCRKHGISTASVYEHKSTLGGLDVSDARKLGAPEDDNVKLRKLSTEQMRDNAMPKGDASRI